VQGDNCGGILVSFALGKNML
jgi:hypothetical protein